MTTIISKSGTGIPPSDQLETAELAVDASNGDLYTKLSDGTVVQINGGSGSGGVEEAPIDTKQYARQDGAWSEVVIPDGGGGGGAGVLISGTEPADKTEGMMWMDTSASPALVWIWDGAAWVEFPFVGSSPKLAAPIPKIEYLVIAGGGAGGGGAVGGGGGAGGYRTNVTGDLSGGNSSAEATPAELLNVPLWTQFIVKVGEGGFNRTGAGTGASNSEKKGQNSSFGPVVSTGGGRGGSGNGGSGGGATGVNSGSNVGGNPQTNQGFKGGDSQSNTLNGGGGAGGGGAGTTEVANGNDRDGNHGGAGLVSSIDGLNKARAGGGGGASGTSRTPGDGGNGGGGQGGMGGSSNPAILPTAGEPNTGGGGGAGSSTSGDYDHNLNIGGSGVVIVRYQGPQYATGGVVTTHNGYTVHTFTSGEAIFNVTGPMP